MVSAYLTAKDYEMSEEDARALQVQMTKVNTLQPLCVVHYYLFYIFDIFYKIGVQNAQPGSVTEESNRQCCGLMPGSGSDFPFGCQIGSGSYPKLLGSLNLFLNSQQHQFKLFHNFQYFVQNIKSFWQKVQFSLTFG